MKITPPPQPAVDTNSAEATKPEGDLDLDDSYSNVDADTPNNDNGIVMHWNGPGNGGNNSTNLDNRFYIAILQEENPDSFIGNEPQAAVNAGFWFVGKSSNDDYTITGDTTNAFDNNYNYYINENAFRNHSRYQNLWESQNVEAVADPSGVDLNGIVTKIDTNKIIKAYLVKKGKDSEDVNDYKLIPYVIKHEKYVNNNSTGGWHIDCQVVKKERVKNISNFTKSVVTSKNGLPTDIDSTGYTFPENGSVTFSESTTSVTLLYKLTVTGDKGAKFVITDESATQVSGSLTGTIPEAGNVDVYVSRTFSANDIKNGYLVNTATIAPNNDNLTKVDDSKSEATAKTPATKPETPTQTKTVNAKYFVLMPSKGKPTSGQNQGPRNYFPNATDNGGVKYGSLTGYKGKIYTSIIQDHPEADTRNGYFVANGIESKYLVVPSDLGYFSEGYTGEFPSVLGDNFTMEGKRIIWYVVKNVVTSLTPSYHVDGYLAGVPVELRYHENFNFSGTDDVIVTVDKNGDKNLLSGETVTISGISEDITAKHPGWTFVGWTENRDGSGTVYTAGSTKVMMDSCDLYAKWTKTDPNPDPPPAPPTLVKAKFFINLGGKEASNPKGTGTFTKGIEIQGAINLDVFNRNKTGGSAYGNGGYIFNINGVETNSECTGLLNQKPEDTDINNDINAELPTNEQGSMDIGSDTGREVVWYHVSHCGDGYHVDGYIKNVDITITYNPDGGTFADGTTNNKTKQGLSGQVHTIIADIPTKSGHVFAGWKVEGDSSNKIYKNGDSITRMSDLTLVAQWEKDVWKDADKDSSSTEKDSKTGGDGIPDSQQILIEYKAYKEGNGTVDSTFEVITVKENGTLTPTKGSTANAETGYVFVTWSDKNAVVNETTVDSIVSSAAATTKIAKLTPNLTASDKGQTYTYTAIFLEDKVGGKDKGDGIPDAWQYKVTFKVKNGSWNDKTNAAIVKYVTKKDAEGNNSATGTATLSAVPAVGNEPNSGYRTSGSWDKPLSVGLEIKKDTEFTFTYSRRSSSGGNSRPSTPTVTIPDDVPTGLNGKDHYAYIIGYGNNDVRPQNNITRAEVATIFFRLLTDETREANMTKSNGYNDVKDGDWFCCAVSTLSKMGIIKGYEDGSFKPNDPISRAEFAAIAARFDPDGDKTPATFADVTSHWAKDEISIAANHGWIKGYEDGSFKPDQKITRAETMTLVNRVLNRLPETKDDLHKDMKTWVDNMDETAWYYLAVQEATNSHYFKNKTGTKFEQWTDLRDTRDWSELEK